MSYRPSGMGYFDRRMGRGTCRGPNLKVGMALRTEAIWCSFYLFNQCSVLPRVLCLRVPDVGGHDGFFPSSFFLGVRRRVPVFVIVPLESDFFLFACFDWSVLRMGLINGELTLPSLCSTIQSLIPVEMSQEL